MIGHAVQALRMLALTMALILWAAAGGGVPVSTWVETPAVASVSVPLSKTSAAMATCRERGAGHHGMCMSAAACAAHCASNTAIIPVALHVPTAPTSCAGLTAIAEAEGRSFPPDPPPPRAVIIG